MQIKKLCECFEIKQQSFIKKIRRIEHDRKYWLELTRLYSNRYAVTLLLRFEDLHQLRLSCYCSRLRSAG